MLLSIYLINSSLHGLFFIGNKKLHWTERLFWIIVTVLSWVGSIILMINTLVQYINQESTFVVDTSYLGWNTRFPAIFFCEKLNDNYKQFPELRNKHLLALEETLFFSGQLIKGKTCETDQADCVWGNFSYYSSLIKNECKNVFSYCEYNYQSFDCCEKFVPIQTYYGMCFAINSIVPNLNHQPIPEPLLLGHNRNSSGKLVVEVLNVEIELRALSKDAVISPVNARNALVDSESSNTLIKQNKEVFVYLKTTEIISENNVDTLDFDKRRCRFPEENNLWISNFFSESICFNQYEAEAEELFCNCITYTIARNSSVECDLKGMQCIFDINTFNMIKNMTSAPPCLASCSKENIEIVGQSVEDIKGKRRFVDGRSKARLNFIVQAPTVRYLRTVVKVPLDILVSVGGVVSLFFGASILSLIEIFYYLLIYPCGDAYMKKEEKKKEIQFKQNSETKGHPSKFLFKRSKSPLPFIH